MKLKILVIDDETKVCESIKEYGQEIEGYKMDYAFNSQQALDCITKSKYDAIMLDIQLGHESGFDVLKIIKQKINSPVILMSATHDSELVAEGFKLGAEDYVKKSTDLKELFIRIKKAIERSSFVKKVDSEINVADYTINELSDVIYKDGKKIDIVGMPYKILVYLLKNANQTVTREELYTVLWGANYQFSSRVIDTHIKVIRKSTMDANIKTVHGKGYKFQIDEYGKC